MRTRELNRLDRKLARLLGWTIDYWGNFIDTHGRGRGYTWSPSRDIAQALEAVREAGYRVAVNNYYAGLWEADILIAVATYVTRSGHCTAPLAVVMALIAALEARKVNP